MMMALQVVVGTGGQEPVISIVHGGMPSGAIFSLILIGIFAGTFILWPLVRAWSRRIEGRGQSDQGMLDEVESLRQRVAHLEDLQGRVVELEERADFAERMLTQQREPERLPGGSAN